MNHYLTISTPVEVKSILEQKGNCEKSIILKKQLLIRISLPTLPIPIFLGSEAILLVVYLLPAKSKSCTSVNIVFVSRNIDNCIIHAYNYQYLLFSIFFSFRGFSLAPYCSCLLQRNLQEGNEDDYGTSKILFTHALHLCWSLHGESSVRKRQLIWAINKSFIPVTKYLIYVFGKWNYIAFLQYEIDMM